MSYSPTANIKDSSGNALQSNGSGALKVDASATTQPVSGPLTDTQLRANAVPVSGPLTDTQLRANAVPVSASSLPLPSGAAQEHTAANSPHSVRLTDGSSFYKPTTPSDTQPVSGTI